MDDVKLISCLLTTEKAHFHPSGYINEQKIPINSTSDLQTMTRGPIIPTTHET